MPLSNLLFAVGVVVFTSLGCLLLVSCRHRSRINGLRKSGIPMPAGWNWITGHLLILDRTFRHLPRLANLSLVIQELCREFADTEMFILDLWPAFAPAIITFNPESELFISQKYNLPKPSTSLESVKPIVGGPSLLSMNGSEWKIWRSLLNPGFSTASLVEHVPYIVDCVEVFCSKLLENAGNGILSLDDFATKLTFDVIMKVTLDADINYQRSEHILATALSTITNWHSFWDPRVLLNPARPFIQMYYGYIMKNYIGKELEQRFADLKRQHLSSPTSQGTKKAKSIIALALEAFVEETKGKEMLEGAKLDPEFASMVTCQTRLFLLAGNDTTSSTIVYIYHTLSKHPEVLSQLRREHDSIFGLDISQTTTLLKTQSALLNNCRYTLAVIKETLRLYPPATNMRQGLPGVSLTALDGRLLDTGGFHIIINHQATHTNPRVWVRATEFLPERWLVQADHELYPPHGAYRPFDIGPRACIGQALTLNEMRIVLIMTARKFNITPAYEEWDEIQHRAIGWWARIRSGIWGKDINTVNGDRAYQTEKAGTHPSDGYPCRVELVQK
ncbi:Cytochrome P450 [Glarea lozoyensis ATCC 20868]|uniref:Cytochrome P450 n=1 Tax=Glarea lozoyensis (strain ATCC 20868 / MF5171) TaxID=1116229 RepID=S3DFH8_GLAL2|nr:Cytochrome P450 [Glarea lozoyensis ATCC 20868]EPE37167.1 Cytochrome P450 [Glarea lozoyensis ATCC 20868]